MGFSSSSGGGVRLWSLAAGALRCGLGGLRDGAGLFLAVFSRGFGCVAWPVFLCLRVVGVSGPGLGLAGVLVCWGMCGAVVGALVGAPFFVPWVRCGSLGMQRGAGWALCGLVLREGCGLFVPLVSLGDVGVVSCRGLSVCPVCAVVWGVSGRGGGVRSPGCGRVGARVGAGGFFRVGGCVGSSWGCRLLCPLFGFGPSGCGGGLVCVGLRPFWAFGVSGGCRGWFCLGGSFLRATRFAVL